MIGAIVSFLIRYFGMKAAFTSEFILAATLLFSGLFISFIPYISKSYTTQNTLFLIVSILTMLYFTIINIKTAATTVWAAYIIFLLFTVILDSKMHAHAFVISSIAIQIIFWIAYPKVSVIIDGNEYTTRIFIIALSFFAVRYVTNEYESKIQGFKRFSREQETLETISSSFISVDIENVKVKIDELLVESFEILEFDNAYLVDFDADYENATISNMYVKDIENKSLPFYSGISFKTSDFPMVKSLIELNTPITVEDITDIPIDEDPNQRKFFLSRGIRSFFALPITTDNRTTGMLVVEYKERNDIRFTENRLHFMIILSNMLGDTWKKLRYEKMLYDIAYFDETTKLANSNMLKIKLTEFISDSKKDKKIAVLDIKLENLRMINDTFGHAVGEQVMIESAAILKTLLSDCCYLSRTGEASFTVVLPEAVIAEQIEECAGRLLSSFSHPISTESGVEALFVIARIGISVYPDHGTDADTLIKSADLAGYEARNTDKDYVFYTERLENEIAETTLLTNKLFQSLENKEFSLEFQPQISCETGKTAGFEALLRWTTDDNRRIPPNRFIPMLEQTGLIYDVGLWVLEEALKEHKKLVEKGFPPLRVSVNLSVVQFEEESFISDIARIIEESGINPEYIELEITESLFSKDPKDVLEKLYKLKELGMSLAIDDFGSGYSSLNRLKRVPFDRIKIDKAIIDHIDLDDKSAPITKTIILLAREFRAGITAEGVETKNQADFLKSIFCGEIQGYYYSRPLTSEALEEFLRKETESD
ncbi:MAG: EAL domain-containing protein [Ruminococcaceae bacterium]|nr:EAL domain-containing protein [Oscillospiraceae bacterium]